MDYMGWIERVRFEKVGVVILLLLGGVLEYYLWYRVVYSILGDIKEV